MRAVRKGGPYDVRHAFRTGDGVRVSDVPAGFKDPEYGDDLEMRTGELFRFCVGRKFVIRGFGRYGHIELQVDDDPAVKKKFGLNSIWIEPTFLELVTKTRRKVERPADGFGWKEDVQTSEETQGKKKGSK